MFQLQFVIGLFIGFNFDIIQKVLNSPINAENDYYGAKARSLFDDSDRSMNVDEAYSEKELENIFSNTDELDDISIEEDLRFKKEKPIKLWPNGVIPFEIGSNYTKRHIENIKLAMNELSSKTSIRFQERTVEKDYVYFNNRKAGCSSKVGLQGGLQNINLNIPGCVRRVGKIIHEIVHTVGFHHEQARNDRDDYVKIMWDNIPKDHKKNFVKLTQKIDPNVDLTYDYSSIMHYKRYDFAIDPKKPTMVPLVENEKSSKMGQRTGLSPLDIKKINAKYQFETKTQNQNDGLEFISFQFKSGNISLDLKYNADDMNNE